MNMNDAFVGSLIFNKDGGGGGAILITKSIYDNGVYSASDDNADGYSSVMVNIPRGGLGGTECKIISTTYTTL